MEILAHGDKAVYIVLEKRVQSDTKPKYKP